MEKENPPETLLFEYRSKYELRFVEILKQVEVELRSLKESFMYHVSVI